MADLRSVGPDFEIDSRTETPSSKTENKQSALWIQDYNFHKCIEKIISRPYSYNYFYDTIDDESVGDEYKRFIHFIDKQEDPVKSELTMLVYPVFVHFYLVLIRNTTNIKEKKVNGTFCHQSPTNQLTICSAEIFFEDYVKLFENAEGYKDILEQLFSLKTVDDVIHNDYFKKFWKMKYACRLSINALRSLKSFLEEKKTKLLLNILRFHFYFEYDKDIDSPNFADLCESDILSVDKKLTSSSFIYGDDQAMWNMWISNVFISRIVLDCNTFNYSSVDLNDDESQIAVAHSSPFISIAALQKQISEELQVDSSVKGTMKRISLPKPVHTVKFVPGTLNNVLVSCGTEVKLLNSATGSVVSTFKGKHTNSIVDIDVNSEATFFVTASGDMTSCLYSFKETKAVRQDVHKDCVNKVKFHPNGIYFAAGVSDGTVRLHSICNSVSIRSFERHENGVHCLAFSSDGVLMASGDSLGIIKIWNIDGNNIVSTMSISDTFEVHLSRISSLCFSHDNSAIAACNYKGIFKMYQVKCASRYAPIHVPYIPILLKCHKKGWIVVCKDSNQ